MILGRGSAATDDAVVAEYQQFLDATTPTTNAAIRQRLKGAPLVMVQRIGKPLAHWTDDDILAVYVGRQKGTHYYYSAFVAFLLFRGYRRASLPLLVSLPCDLGRMHRSALQPYRQKLEAIQREMSYGGAVAQVGSELTLLIFLLAMVHKPLEELTRVDFDAFREEYQRWYCAAKRRGDGRVDADLTRLEYYLVHWGVIVPAKVVFRHEQHFAHLRHLPIREAILSYMRWCEAKYQPSTIHSCRAAVLAFFHWLQDQYPEHERLDAVTRPIALAYASDLQRKVAAGTYSAKYRSDLYRRIRLFFEFTITERLATSPDRNPFAVRDMPHDPDPIPRYLTDQEVRTLLAYSQQQATCCERALILTLLHTGIRASELAVVKASDLVEVQGRWKLHIHEGKGLKDRVVPLTAPCLAALQAWQEHGWERISAYLFSHHGRPWRGRTVGARIRELGQRLGIPQLTPHRFRHTFAVALLNYGIRESALQKLMGHATLDMTLGMCQVPVRQIQGEFRVRSMAHSLPTDPSGEPTNRKERLRRSMAHPLPTDPSGEPTNRKERPLGQTPWSRPVD